MNSFTLKELRSLVRELAGADEQEARELLKKFPKEMTAIGIDPNKQYSALGTGTRGTAFDLGDGKVLKITSDEKEAGTVATLVGKDIKNVVKFYDVWQFGDTNFYGIVQEKLTPLSAEEGKEFNNALVATGLPLWIAKGGSWDDVKKLTKHYVGEQIKKKYGSYESPEAKAYAQSVNEQWNKLVNQYGLRDLFKTLTLLGIDFHDHHAGNLMKRDDGTYVLIDLGFSKVKGTGSMKIVKEFIKLELQKLNERRIREADVSDGSKVPWGDRKHIKDLEVRIADLLKWRDKQKKGSEARATYSRLISRLKGELASAKRQPLRKSK